MLIHAAAGGVGIAATQIAKAAGAEVHGTASPGKHDAHPRASASTDAIDYRRDGWEKGLAPYDMVLDAIGGASLRALLRAAAPRRAARRLRRLVASTQGEKRNLAQGGAAGRCGCSAAST